MLGQCWVTIVPLTLSYRRISTIHCLKSINLSAKSHQNPNFDILPLVTNPMSTCQNLQHQHPLKPSHLLPFTLRHTKKPTKARPGGWPGESAQRPGLGRLHRDQLHGLRPWQPQGLRPLGYVGGRWMELEGGVFAKRSDGFWGAWEGCHHGEVTETENHGTSKIATKSPNSS